MSKIESIFKKLDTVKEGFEIRQYSLHGPVDVQIFWRSEKDENGIDLRCVEERGTNLLEAATKAYSQYLIKSYKPKYSKDYRVTCAVNRMLKQGKIKKDCAIELMHKRGVIKKDIARGCVDGWFQGVFKNREDLL